MEKLLVRLAQQLDAIDEASLMSLWSKYATTASRFEPTKRWEEATLVFSLIQAKRWKNQLFYYFPLILGFVRRYEKDTGMGTVIANMLPYSISFTIVWLVMLSVWVILDLPLGPGGFIHLG